MKEIYDLTKLIKVTIINKQINTSFKKVKPRKKSFLYGEEILENTYRKSLCGLYTQKELEEKYGDVYIIQNNTVFNKPKVVLSFQGNYEYHKIFETDEETLKWGDKIADEYILKPIINEDI